MPAQQVSGSGRPCPAAGRGRPWPSGRPRPAPFGSAKFSPG